MALKPCRECKAEISTKAKTCPHCGKDKPHDSPMQNAMAGIVLFGLVGVGIAWCNAESDEDRSIRLAQEAIEKAENKRKGFHCLSAWDGSHTALKDEVASRMRDPGSFEHVSTKITPVSSKGTHRLIMQFRAANGFGGMNNLSALAEIQNAGCGFTILNVNDLR